MLYAPTLLASRRKAARRVGEIAKRTPFWKPWAHARMRRLLWRWMLEVNAVETIVGRNFLAGAR